MKVMKMIQNGFQKVVTFVKDNTRKVAVALGISVAAQALINTASAQTSVTTLPFDTSFLYTCLSTPTNAALTVSIGFAAVFMVIVYIKKAISKR
jgi:hypothetical protein